MPDIKFHDGGNIYSFRTKKDELLFNALRERGILIYSPCGGKGSCGSARCWLRGPAL